MFLGLNLSLGRMQGGGGPPALIAAGSIDAQPLVGDAILLTEPTVSGSSSVAFQWYRGAPTTTPISGATSAGYTPVDGDYGLTLYRRATYTNATGDTIDDIAAPSVVGKVYAETFAAFTDLDPTATVLAAGWTRSNTGIEAQIMADATAPSGLGMDWWGTPSSYRSLYRNDWDTFANTYGTDDYEELFLYKHQTAAGRFALRPHNGAAAVGTSAGAGFAVRLGVLFAQLPGEDPNDPAASGSTNLGTLTVGQYYWLRKRSSGTLAQFKFWNSTVSEPSAWNASRTHGSALVNRGPSIAYRAGTASDKQRLLYLSVGHLTAAPFPADYELPVPTSSDLMTFAAGSAATTFAQFDSLIDYNFASVTQGRYCNGDPFLINASGVSVTSITPASADVSGRWTNGAMVNFGEGGGASGPTVQGFDGYVPSAGLYIAYDAAENIDPGKTGSALAFAAAAEGSILKAVSKTTPDPAQNARDRIDCIGVMTVVASAPPTNAFRPGVAAPSKVSHWTEDDINWSYIPDLIMPSSAPSITNTLAGQRCPLMAWTTKNDHGRTVRGNSNHVDYGPDIIRDGATALLMALNNDDPTTQRNIIVAMVQRGIDVHARAVEGGNWREGGGGTGNGRKFFLTLAAHLLDDAGMAAYCDPAVNAIWTEDLQHRYVTASDVTSYDYEAADEGMPEWMNNPYITTPSRSETAGYRAVNTNWQSGAALAIQLIGAKSIWANPAFFDYQDRVMERTFFDGSGTSAWALSLSGTNSPPQFHRDMWSSYRTRAGMPAIWNW